MKCRRKYNRKTGNLLEMFSLNVLHIAQLKLIYTIFGDPITGYRQNLLDLYSVSDLSKDSQLWKKRETNQES